MKKIMIVDDSSYMRMQLKKIIESDSDFILIGEAENGKKALEILKKETPDIITLDMTMPEMDGISFLKELKKTKNNFKIIIVSALSHEKRLISAIQLGASDFIRKPYDIKNILQILKKYK